MSDWLGVFGEMHFDSLFVVAGLVLLAIGVIGKISGKIGPTARARAILAVVGISLVVSGVWIRSQHLKSSVNSPPQPGGAVPGNEVHAQETKLERHPATDRLPGDQHHAGLAYFTGRWKNKDANTRGLTTLAIRTAGPSVWVHAWGACRPSDCDWGEVAGTPLSPSVSSNPTNDAEKVTAVFETSFSNTILTLGAADDDELQADTQTRFTDNSGRSGYAVTYTFRHGITD